MQPDWQDLISQTVKDESLRNAYVWEPFARGSSNTIFLGRLKLDELSNPTQQTVVLRINAAAKDTPGVDRQREATVLDWIQSYRWSPQIIRNEPEQGWCLMRHYANGLNTAAPSPESLPSEAQNCLVTALNELHNIEIIDKVDANLITHYDTLLNEAYLGIAEARNDTQALTWIQSIKNDLATLPALPQCLVHHDLHLGNLIFSADSSHTETEHSLTILDWEYASIGSPWFDASCLSRYLSMPTPKIYQLICFNTLDEVTFAAALNRANQMTETLQNLWYRTRE